MDCQQIVEKHTNKIIEYMYEEYKYVDFDEDIPVKDNITYFKESIYFSVLMLKHKGNEIQVIEEMLQLFYGKIPDGYWILRKEERKRKRVTENFVKVKKQLMEYFFNHQYDDKYIDYFKACDRHNTFDEDGEPYTYYVFYN